ncbi:hypothetical protein [Rivularia sp. UHCC 0363]|uniref:hypothetical protein n=1 Tax=Rivularia sp. UHCC 0363 TaxID=3110244 RepID=UPI002B20D9FE|nr:hypothetical protein [Rivularia sp. UHCC 0363]MEA5596225.1 hypothetical protein [Rivularia sp. UHCC 0363]
MRPSWSLVTIGERDARTTLTPHNLCGGVLVDCIKFHWFSIDLRKKSTKVEAIKDDKMLGGMANQLAQVSSAIVAVSYGITNYQFACWYNNKYIIRRI